MKLSDITLKNIKAFIEGNTKMLGDRLGLLPKHEQEQVIFRASLCGDCLETGECRVCGCSVPGKFYVAKSCNDGERFPDLMDKEKWDLYKIENNLSEDIKLP